ncbi:hypothetical protein [Microbacterium sp. YY-01]|uniref:hypothetical protein n=1 Tax=Microbacterium sp. YY-01 TaxID=3421634 RepID=UPI003D16E35E
MIYAGLLLSAIGLVDLIGATAPRRLHAVLWSVVAIIVVALAVISGAAVGGVIAAAAAVAWLLVYPPQRPARAGIWPALVLALGSGALVAIGGEGAASGVVTEHWSLVAPFGPVSIDVAILTIGVGCFLLESSNKVVRAALASENIAPDAADPTPTPSVSLRGGRMIGPLERILVMVLTLAGAYGFIAAVLAAKGIVRFPEISHDRAGGSQAEYFLVGSLVSWSQALAGALLIWWAYGA